MDTFNPTTGCATAAPLPSWTSRLSIARVPAPVLQGLLAFAIYLTVFITVYARAVLQHLGQPELLQYFTDPNFFIWSIQWWPYALEHGINPLFTSQIGAPQGYSLAWATTVPSVALLMWPVTAVFGVMASFNAVLLLAPPVSAWAAFVAARRLTGRFWASLLAGAAYGLFPYELNHNWQGDINLTVIALLPLMVYLVLAWWDEALKDRWFTAALALAIAVEFYTFTEAFFDMSLVWAGGLLIGFAVAGAGARRKVARLAGLAGIAYAAAVAAAAPYLYYVLKHNQGMAVTRQSPEFSLRLARLVLPAPEKVFGIEALMRYSARLSWWDLDDYVGLPIILVLLALAVIAWRNRVTRLLLAGFVFVTALAVGPVLYFGNTAGFRLPWAGLWSLPIARSAEPSRFIIFIALVTRPRPRALAGGTGQAHHGQPAVAGSALGPRGSRARGDADQFTHGHRGGKPDPAALHAAADRAPGQPAARVPHRRPLPPLHQARGNRRRRHQPEQRRDAVPGRNRLLLPDRGRLHQRVTHPGQRSPPRRRGDGKPLEAHRPGVRELHPVLRRGRHHRRAGVGTSLDEQLLRKTPHARDLGGRGDHLPDSAVAHATLDHPAVTGRSSGRGARSATGTSATPRP